MPKILRGSLVLALGFLLHGLATSPVSAKQVNKIKVLLLNTGVQTPAKGKVQFVSNATQKSLKISVSRMQPGTYDVAVDGDVVDSLRVNQKGKATLQHRSVQNARRNTPLPYDPRGGEIAIRSGGTTVLRGEVPESSQQNQQHVEIEFELTNLGLVPGEAEASFEERSGRMQFEVELEDVPDGTYDLLVDGVLVGTIIVVDGEGEIEFDSIPGDDDDDECDDDLGGDIQSDESNGHDLGQLDILLTFDPRGKLIEIQQNGINLFAGVFPVVSTDDDDDDEDDDDDDDEDDDDDDDDDDEDDDDD